MRSCYESLPFFQVGWSSLQACARTKCNTHRVPRMQTGGLGNLEPRIVSKMCPKNFQTTLNCGGWVNCGGHVTSMQRHARREIALRVISCEASLLAEVGLISFSVPRSSW